MRHIEHVRSESGISTRQSDHTGGTLLSVHRELLVFVGHDMEYLSRSQRIDDNHAMGTLQSDQAV